MNNLKLLELGTKVKFGVDFEINGEISAICIRETSDPTQQTITYEITFFKDAEIKTMWLYERNFKIIKTKRVEIGFKNDNN